MRLLSNFFAAFQAALARALYSSLYSFLLSSLTFPSKSSCDNSADASILCSYSFLVSLDTLFEDGFLHIWIIPPKVFIWAFRLKICGEPTSFDRFRLGQRLYPKMSRDSEVRMSVSWVIAAFITCSSTFSANLANFPFSSFVGYLILALLGNNCLGRIRRDSTRELILGVTLGITVPQTGPLPLTPRL